MFFPILFQKNSSSSPLSSSVISLSEEDIAETIFPNYKQTKTIFIYDAKHQPFEVEFELEFKLEIDGDNNFDFNDLNIEIDYEEFNLDIDPEIIEKTKLGEQVDIELDLNMEIEIDEDDDEEFDVEVIYDDDFRVDVIVGELVDKNVKYCDSHVGSERLMEEPHLDDVISDEISIITQEESIMDAVSIENTLLESFEACNEKLNEQKNEILTEDEIDDNTFQLYQFVKYGIEPTKQWMVLL